MAFVNEEMTNQQKSDFAKRNIITPGDYPARAKYHTVDKERNMCLTHLGIVNRDCCYDHWFLFDWNGNEYIICLNYSNPLTDSRAKCATWRISQFDKNFAGDEEFICDLEEAITVYAINGNGYPANIEVNAELLTIMDIKFSSDSLAITFKSDGRFAGRKLVIKGKASLCKFYAYPDSMKWLKPYENEKIDNETRRWIVNRILASRPGKTGFEIIMHQTNKTILTYSSWLNLIMRLLIFVLILLIFIGMLKRFFETF